MANEQRGGLRKAVNLLVALRHPDLSTFEESFATNLSEGGMFVHLREPRPVGTLLRFEVQIAGGQRVMAGAAEVRWVRLPGDPSGPPGMGLRFVALDGQTQELVRRMLAKKQAGAAAARAAAQAATRLEQELLAQGHQPVAQPSPREDAAPADAPSAPVVPAVAPLDVPPAPEDAVDIDLSELMVGLQPAPPSEAPRTEAGEELEVEIDFSTEDLAPSSEVRPVHLRPGPDPARTGPVVGIDLGTTNTCVAVLENGKPKIVLNRSGGTTLPSIVSLSSAGRILVGQRARDQLVLNPQQTIYGAKRLVGRPFDSATVSAVASRFHFPVCADGRGLAAVRLGPDVLAMEEVQGLILQECKELAQLHLNQPVHRAVITVPAYYSEAQRAAVRTAGRLAGLRVERILNEPTAAALGYGLNRGLRRSLLIYDLGGGTFDATLLRLEGNIFEVMATGGDVFLGGMDFDDALTDLLVERFEASEGIAFHGDDTALARVREAAERAKVMLSQQHQVDIHLPMLVSDGERVRDLRTVLTRADLDRACAPLVTRTLDVVRDVLLDAGLKPREVDEVILVGGQSRMPLIHEQLREMFGKAPHAGVNADEAVALGAALFAGTVDKVSSVVLIDVLPMTLGVGLPGGGFKRLIERNVPLPAHRTVTLPTTRDGQRIMELALFQGEATHVGANEYLGTVRLDGLPAAPRGMVKVAVTLQLDAESVLHVEARELTTRRMVQATLATRYTSEQLRTRLGFLREQEQAANAARDQELRSRGGRIWSALRRALGRT
jgi:molecular chaperone DnaK